MADEIDLKSFSEGEANGHISDAIAANGSRDSATVVRAKTKTVLLGGDFAQQIREKLGFNDETETEDGFVQARAATGISSPFRRAFQQSSTSEAVASPRSVATPPAPSFNSAARVVREDLPPVVGFLVSYDRFASGEVYELRLGRWIVSSAATMNDNFLVIADESISQNHATIRVNSGRDIQVIDQFSENGTGIVHADGVEETQASISSIRHGDIIRFGKRSFHVSIVSKA